jgi:hypothetical protein
MPINEARRLARELSERLADPAAGNKMCPRFWECLLIRRSPISGLEYRRGCPPERAATCSAPENFKELCRPFVYSEKDLVLLEQQP